MFIAGTILFWVPIVFALLYIVFNYLIRGRKNICIVVLGDVGRSPRMQYHALSFVKTGFTVEVVGYGGNHIHFVKFLIENLFLESILIDTDGQKGPRTVLMKDCP